MMSVRSNCFNQSDSSSSSSYNTSSSHSTTVQNNSPSLLRGLHCHSKPPVHHHKPWPHHSSPITSINKLYTIILESSLPRGLHCHYPNQLFITTNRDLITHIHHQQSTRPHYHHPKQLQHHPFQLSIITYLTTRISITSKSTVYCFPNHESPLTKNNHHHHPKYLTITTCHLLQSLPLSWSTVS